MIIVIAALLLAAPAADCWQPPVVAPVIDPYREPACRWCPGNRGVTYGPAPGTRVDAVASGVVSFAGVVVGTRYVVVRLPDGRRVTYGGLATGDVATGEVVVRGQRIGRSTGELHLGLRRGDDYLDPTSLLGEWQGRPRLLPTDGSPARTAPPPRLACPARRDVISAR